MKRQLSMWQSRWLWRLPNRLRHHRSTNNRFRRARFEILEQRWVLSTITVRPGLDTIQAAIADAHPGDTLSLKSGVYLVSDTVEIDKNLTIKGASSNADRVQIAPVEESFLGDHIFSVIPDVKRVSFANFTVQGAAGSPTDDPQDGGDGIHTEDVEHVTITNVQATLNGGTGIYIAGATNAELSKVVAMANGAFGVELDDARKATIGDSQVTGNGICGIAATGDDSGLATVSIFKTIATANHETGIGVDTFKRATLKSVTGSNNGEDGFNAADVDVASVESSTFANNLDDGLQLVGVDKKKLKELKTYGNRDQPIDRSDAQNFVAQASFVEAKHYSRHSSTITVYPGLDTIQAAVDDAEPGDTLVLKPGLYLISDTIEIDKDLTIKGHSSNADQVHVVPVMEGFRGDDIFSVLPDAEKVSFSNLTVQGGAESDPETPEDGGDGIHTEGVESVTITNVQAMLNGADGIFIDGAVDVVLDKVVAVANGAFGFDTDGTLNLTVRNSNFLANGISGLEAAGHHSLNVTFTAIVNITNTIAKANGEIGVEVERFKNARLKAVTCSNNLDDGFDADRTNVIAISESTFANNLGDGLELFPINVSTFPPEFPNNIIEKYKELKIFGNRLEEIHHPDTEN